MEATRPLEAERSAPRLAALAWPLTRRISTALSKSPSASVSAFLQSIMPAPVASRSIFTSAAEIVAMSFGRPLICYWLGRSSSCASNR